MSPSRNHHLDRDGRLERTAIDRSREIAATASSRGK
jgi:hypothetical protein